MTAGVDGLVVAGTGNGSVHAELEAALQKAERSGVRVLREASAGTISGTVYTADGSAVPAGSTSTAATSPIPSGWRNRVTRTFVSGQ